MLTESSLSLGDILPNRSLNIKTYIMIHNKDIWGLQIIRLSAGQPVAVALLFLNWCLHAYP
jgi:hypothetical protein